MENHFEPFDYVSVVITLLFPAAIGIYFSRQNETNEDLLLGGRNISSWPVALSVMASFISAVTVLGLPAEVFGYGIEIFNMALLDVIMFPISVKLFVEVMYSLRITSIFEYLELRFQCRHLRKMVAGIYLFEQISLAGIILYGPSLVLDTFLGIPTWLSIFGIGFLCTLYTTIGGIKAVVWTDAFQALVMLFGMLAIGIQAFVKAGGFSHALTVAKENGRLTLFKTNLDIFQRHNFFNFLFGFGFSLLFRSTLHQQQLQRYSSQPTLQHATKSMYRSVPITFIVKTVGLLTGVGIFSIYYNCDPVQLEEIRSTDHILPHFVVKEMKTIPGVLGLFTACIFSSVLSSISSAINSVTAVAWEDFLSEVPMFAKMSAKGQTNVSRVSGLVFGLLSVLLAFSAQYMGPVYSASYQVPGATTGVVLSTFIAGLFMPYINATGAKVGVFVSITTMLTICGRNIFSQVLKEAPLPTSIENCTIEQLSGLGNATILSTTDNSINIEWPEKIFTLSYLVYPLVGASLTLIVATIASYLSGGFRAQNRLNIPETCLHPFIKTRKAKKNLKRNGKNIKVSADTTL